MHVLSRAHFHQAELTQVDRWDYGPLEIYLVAEPESARADFGGGVALWNQGQCAGFARSNQELEFLEKMVGLRAKNPNIVFAPTRCGYSELLGMLGSLLPDGALAKQGIHRPKSEFWLWPLSEEMGFRYRNCEELSRDKLDQLCDDHLRNLASTIPAAFEKWIWRRLVRSKRYGMRDFASDFSLRMLAGDVRFWMHRLYRIAIDLYESLPPTEDEEDSWCSLRELRQRVHKFIPVADRKSFRLTRPREGGTLWEPKNPDDRKWIADVLLDGDSTAESLEPVVETLLGSAAHDDFSDRYSWIKEDFERAFYSKRSKVKVKLCEFIDEAVHDGAETPGYANILFRDLMAFFDQRDRTIILALRQGKTQSAIAEQLGCAGHASISRRIEKIETKMRRLLREN
jgi:hypothetical protein